MLRSPSAAPSSSVRAWIGASFGTMVSVLPGFLTGAMGVQLRAEVGLSVAEIGVALGAFFATAAALSAPMGRLAQRVGARFALRCGLTTSAASMTLLATVADSATWFWGLLALAGAGNALNQPSANLLLASEIDPRSMGMAIALKQSGMPMAALLGGAAVPTIALTVGWEWAYLTGAALAAVAVTIPPQGRATASIDAEARTSTAPDLGLGLLSMYAAVGLLGASAATVMVAFLTSGAEASGVGEGAAGLLLSVGSASGIASRLVHGYLVDRHGILPIRRVIWLFGLGAMGVALFILDHPAAYTFGAVPAFGFGWAWPGLFNLSVIRRNPSAPASATGISQIGVFVGAGSGPVLGGLLIDGFGYSIMWATAAGCLAVGSVVAASLAARLRAATPVLV